MTIHKLFRNLLFITMILGCVLTGTVFAQQSDNGSLRGTVTDNNSAVVPNATVKAVSVDTGLERMVVTNAEGAWTITGLKIGNYRVTAEAANFAITQPTEATVTAAETTELVLVLGVAGLENQVDISIGDTTSTINTDPGAVTGSTITGQRIEESPAPTRSVFNFLGGDPSVSVDLTEPQTNGTGNGEPSINGSRTTSIGIQFNGIDATNFSGTGSLTGNISPAPETVQEVKVQTSLYDASLGRNGGGSIQVVTRNGTNEFRGSAYIFGQNEAFNANDFFFNRDGIDRQRARRVEGGFTIGGPIIKNKLWFFGGYQRTDAETAYVPTAQSLVVLPAALQSIGSDRSPEALFNAFRAFGSPQTFTSNCIQIGTCIRPNLPGFRLFQLRNPLTGQFLLPSLAPGTFRPIYVDLNNTIFLDPQVAAIFGNQVPELDRSLESRTFGGNQLVRVRQAFPADFKQDQFTTRLDYNVLKGDNEGKNINTLYGTFFFANFPASEPFTDDTLVSPFPLVKNDRNRTLAITDQHIFNGNWINEVRFGLYSLNNSRSLDERLLTPEFTNTGLGIINPASFFVPGPESERCARVAGRDVIQDFSVCAPNDTYNQRKQLTITYADNVTYTRGSQTFRFGVEFKQNYFDTNLPEEQGAEFERLDNFTQILTSRATEADTSFGITDKKFRFNDLSFYISDDWKVSERLTLNLGLRWDFFGRVSEKNGFFTNFDPSLLTNPDDPRPGFILPSNATETGFNAIDASLTGITRGSNNHTLNGQDWNNFAPRIGFSWAPFKNGKTTIRGGYGIFYDRPSASFINTVYSNYPFLREVEVASEGSFAPSFNNAFQGNDPNVPFAQFLPYQARFVGNLINDVTLVRSGVTIPGLEDTVEPLEFRAVDRDLKTPIIQQWNLGIQQEFGDGWVIEGRYIGTRGQNLLLAIGFNQAYDLNDSSTPDYIFKRLNDAYEAAGSPFGPLRANAANQRERGCGLAFGNIVLPNIISVLNTTFQGFQYPFGPTCPGFAREFDYNFSSYNATGLGGTALINPDLRVPYLGIDPTDAVILQSRGYSIYHSGQINISKRFSKGISFNASYTLSKSIDIGSTDPGSTTASGRPDTPNLGLVVQGDQRDIESNRALSDFDRRHRFSASFVWEIPNFGSKSKFLTGWQLSGFGQWQSGTPFSILASDPEFRLLNNESLFQDQFLGQFFIAERRRDPRDPSSVLQTNRLLYNAGRGSGNIFGAAFGRPNVRSLELLTQRTCPDITQCYFNTRQNPNDSDAALLASFGRFGNLGRNILTGPSQKRIDLSLSKTTKFFKERMELELKWDIFNVFNFVNFANPNADFTDETDFGQITRTVGAPRVMQFGAKIRF